MGSYLERFANKRAMITGGLGFIGSNLARRLVGLGAKVVLVDSLIPGCGGNLFNISGIEDKVKVHIADVRHENNMNHLVRGQDYIFNLAGQGGCTNELSQRLKKEGLLSPLPICVLQ